MTEKEKKQDVEVVQVAKELELKVRVGDDILGTEQMLAEILKEIREIKKSVV